VNAFAAQLWSYDSHQPRTQVRGPQVRSARAAKQLQTQTSPQNGLFCSIAGEQAVCFYPKSSPQELTTDFTDDSDKHIALQLFYT
jgi:hypothetical protein